MGVYQFVPGQEIEWKGMEWEVTRLLPQGKLQIESAPNGAVLITDQKALAEALFAGELRFVGKGEQPRPGGGGGGAPDLSVYPAEAVAVAKRRLAIVQEVLALLERTRAAVAQIVAKYRQQEGRHPALAADRGRPAAKRTVGQVGLCQAVSVSSVYRWVADYRRSQGDIRSLIPSTARRGGRGESRLDPAVERIIDGVIADECYGGRREQVTAVELHEEVARRIAETNRVSMQNLRVPSLRVLEQRLAGLDPRRRAAIRFGKRAAEQRFRQYGVAEEPLRLLERVETDHTLLDVVVVDEEGRALGRPTLTLLLECATRMVFGYYLGFEPPSALTVMEALYCGIRPKTSLTRRFGTRNEWPLCGIPRSLVTDNGREFIGVDLADACQQLGITLVQLPVRQPHLKGKEERFFRTLAEQVVHGLPGTTFAAAAERRDYPSLAKACLTLAELEAILVKYFVDKYPYRFHRGLGDTPANRLAELLQLGFAPRFTADPTELAVILGRVGERIIQPYGIEFEALRYNRPELGDLRVRLGGKPVKFKYHPADISRLYVWDPFGQRYLEVPALGQAYAQGLSLWAHRVNRQRALRKKGEVDIVALAESGREIRQIVAEAQARQDPRRRRALSRAVARYLEAGRAPSLAEPADGWPEEEGEGLVPAGEESEEPSFEMSRELPIRA